MSNYARLYIDFDGVICDSVFEAFICSYLAYHQQRRIAVAKAATEARALFYRYRPFIRSGQHLVLLQHCIARGIALSSQDDFEAQLRRTPPDRLMEWRHALYHTRGLIIEAEPTEYIGLNSLYECMRPHLTPLSQDPRAVILSTKKEHVISLLLTAAGIQWPQERILTSSTRSKIEMIEERQQGDSDGRGDGDKKPQAVAFIDDHLPHILTIDEGRKRAIDCYLADWGYVLPEWRDDRRYAHLGQSSVGRFVLSFVETK